MRPVLRLLASACRDLVRSRASLAAENLLLRHQLMLVREAGQRGPRFHPIDRLLWALASRLLQGWRRALLVVQPETVVASHGRGFRLFWAWKSRGGRPTMDRKTIVLLREMAANNPLWGAPRIHGELLKLGIRVAESTVSRYQTKPSHRPGSGRWSAFLRNHAKAIAAADFFVVPTVMFRLLYVFLVLDLELRRILHFNVTAHASAEWIAQPIVDAFPGDTAPTWLLRDRDSTYGAIFRRRVANMGIKTLLSARWSPWQNRKAPLWRGREEGVRPEPAPILDAFWLSGRTPSGWLRPFTTGSVRSPWSGVWLPGRNALTKTLSRLRGLSRC